MPDPRTSAKEPFQVAVVGGGPGGYVAALRAAQLGLRTALVETRHLGGVCANWGCIPTKALLHSAQMQQELRGAAEFGLAPSEGPADFARVIARSRQAAERMRTGVAFLLKKQGVTVFAARARLAAARAEGPVRLALEGAGAPAELIAQHVILATGARPRTLPAAPFDGTVVIDAARAMALPEPPARLAIIGAGAIGVEFAYFYRAFGSEVAVIEMLPHLLPQEDEEVSKALERAFKKQQIRLLLGAEVAKLTVARGAAQIAVRTGGKTATVEADRVLVAIGVQGNSEELGLEAAGVATARGFVTVDDRYRTSAPGVYALGDLIGPPLLAHAASAEARACVAGIADPAAPPRPVNAENVPGCVYCRPQVASVGLTERAARARFGDEVQVGTFPFTASGKAVALGATEGFVKLLCRRPHGELLGAHLVGAGVTELIGEFVLAKTHELTIHELADTVHAHPTLAEALGEAAEAALGRAVHV